MIVGRGHAKDLARRRGDFCHWRLKVLARIGRLLLDDVRFPGRRDRYETVLEFVRNRLTDTAPEEFNIQRSGVGMYSDSVITFSTPTKRTKGDMLKLVDAWIRATFKQVEVGGVHPQGTWMVYDQEAVKIQYQSDLRYDAFTAGLLPHVISMEVVS